MAARLGPDHPGAGGGPRRLVLARGGAAKDQPRPAPLHRPPDEPSGGGIVTGEALARRWRVLAGDREAALARLSEALAAASLRCHWFGDRAPPGIRPLSPREVTAALGSECDLLVYDAHAGLHPDALAALLGTLRGGGEWVLLTPPWSAWAGFDDPALARLAPWPLGRDAVGRRFVTRLQRLLEAAGPGRIQPADTPLALRAPADRPRSLRLNAAQQAAVAAIERVARGHARRPLVLLADRGRGKSTAIGSALARLLKSGSKRILLLAPSRAAVGAVFDQLARELPEGEQGGEAFSLGGAEVRFCLPAHYLEAQPACELLVVDEAAALGLPLLQCLCERHNRLVFSTTVHGYEGSGRGFVHRFCASLDRHYRQWRRLELQEPVRWAPGDPLEA
ncbi:MAG TPA: tRNA(Met) cytidine acetyltransferase, partial [Gammaproteobacteria bacterium]|nr:tRNA(Met) cytidine acetyltransferase [Gammaproteobacteria bacterium]